MQHLIKFDNVVNSTLANIQLIIVCNEIVCKNTLTHAIKVLFWS